MKVVAFVDDEKGILDGLRRMLRSRRKEWDMNFYLSGRELLTALPEKRFDIVISDMRMPQMSGGELLQQVKQLSPGTLRVVLSGYANDELILESLHATHQFISKPADQDRIIKTINRAVCLQDSLDGSGVQSVLGSIESLPCLPGIYDQLMAEISSDDASIDRVGELISQDMALSSSLLKIVNSAFFGLVRHIESPAQAASVLGLEAVKNLAFSTSVFACFANDSARLKEMEGLNSLGQKVGMLVGRIAQRSSLGSRSKDHAQMAGMMINLGALVSMAFADEIDQTSEHAQDYPLLGSYLLGIWAMPFPVVEAVRWYQQPALSTIDEPSPLAVVHAAWAMLTLFLEKQEIDLESGLLDVDYLDAIVGRETVNEWKNIAENFCDNVNCDDD